MEDREIIKNKFMFISLGTLILVIVSFFIYSFLNGTLSFSSTTSSKWDGVSIASSFSAGNGTKENPYIINDGADFNYFKNLIETNPIYASKNYALGNDIDLGNHDFSSIGSLIGSQIVAFKGEFDGRGHTIMNINILGKNINNVFYYGLFAKLDGAIISNLNLSGIVVKAKDNVTSSVGGILAGELLSNSKIRNISIFDSFVDTTVLDISSKKSFGGFAGIVYQNVNINNIFLDVSLSFSDKKGISKFSDICDSNVSNLVYMNNSIKLDNYFNSSSNNSSILSIYVCSNENNNFTVKNNGKDVSTSSLLTLLNKDITGECHWFYDGVLKLMPNQKTINKFNAPLKFSFGTTSLSVQPSGVSGDTLNINDLESDLNYYKGRNYTEFSDQNIPNGNNQNIYKDSNLAQVYIQYNGQDLGNSSLVGKISLSEQISKINYFKYFKVENNMLHLELIDNPYGNRPKNKVFNGWVTNYKGVSISYDKDIHTYFADIPITDVSKPTTVIFNASWSDGAIVNVSGTNDFSNAFSSLDNEGFKIYGKKLVSEDLSNFYVKRRASRGEEYPSGAVDSNGDEFQGFWGNKPKCNWLGGCEYYILNNAPYNPNEEYYELTNRMLVHKVEFVYEDDPNALHLPLNSSSGGYYKVTTVRNGGSLVGYYDENGKLIESGSCQKNSCMVYDLIPYLKDDGTMNVVNDTDIYARLVTRDSNILVLKGRTSASISSNKPYTLTGINNGVDYKAIYDIAGSGFFGTASNSSIDNDFRMEFLTVDSGIGPGSAFISSGYLYGNYHNLKIGRGIKWTSGNVTFDEVFGGNNSSIGDKKNIKRYKTIVESGFYNNMSITGHGGNAYVEGKMIYGSDLDRVQNNNNLLKINITAAGSWGTNVYGSSNLATALFTDVKSGSFGVADNDYTVGIYVGGLEAGRHYAVRSILVEGGYINNLIGGPISDSSRSKINDILIEMKGGTVDYIFGGAGRSETYGNKIISITGGIVNYAVFGGSNGYVGNNNRNNRGTIDGDTLIYVGGNSLIGSPTALNKNAKYGVKSGCVFGIGNGNANYDMIGSANNSMVIIDGNAVVSSDVYGGGNYGAVGIQSSSGETNTNILFLNGTIKGSLYGGGNNNGSGTSSVKSNINITMYNGVLNGSMFGGANSKGIVYGDTTINVLGGKILKSVYGGGEGGYSSSNPGTYVDGNINVNIGNGSNNELIISQNVYGGSAFGTVNGTTNNNNVSNKDTKVIVNSGIINGGVYGGGEGNATFVPYVLGNSSVYINGGNVGSVYGGNDASGTVNGTVAVYLKGGVVGDCYGGGNETGQNTTNVYLQGSTVSNLFGGSNISGNVNDSHVHITSGKVGNVFGGNNAGGITSTTNVKVDGGEFSGTIYGGGKLANTNDSNVVVGNATVLDVFGGGQQANINKTVLEFNGSVVNEAFGGSNISGVVDNSNITVNGGKFLSIYGGNKSGGTINNTFITINKGNITNLYGGGMNAGFSNSTNSTSNIKVNGGNITNTFGGSNKSGDLGISNIYIGDLQNTAVPINVSNVYGGNNAGGKTSKTNVLINFGTFSTVYGGGNFAPVDSTNVVIKNAKVDDIYGGGNESGVNTNTYLKLNNSTMNKNVFGGGNQGTVKGNSLVFVTDTNINGSLYAGGNGSTAVVYGNTTVTVDGNSSIGVSNASKPHTISLFGGGNAAATGDMQNSKSNATVNIVGGHIYGNVYGGANTSIVYGGTVVNIGTVAVNDKKNTSISNQSKTNLKESDIIIDGTVYGGGESNAEGADSFDYEFKSVIGSINIFIDGTNYSNNMHKFILSGSVFGSGNASSSKGESKIYVKKLGTKEVPSRNISFQRTQLLTIDNSFIELKGITDTTNEFNDHLYTFNIINKLIIKNNTTLLLENNANLLHELYSGVDVNGTLVPATVSINDETKEVIKNVDNRIYCLPDIKLHIAHTADGKSCGKITGMTFFGMYTDNGSSFHYGLYDNKYNYGDSVNAGEMIIGGSHVLGLHDKPHDIKIDGFYTNKFSENYDSIITEYIVPTPPEGTSYRWVIGVETKKYDIELIASKYSSLGATSLVLHDFGHGNTIFNILGFNTDGMPDDISIVDSLSVPKITDVADDANKIFGLALKTESREWTGYGNTKFYSGNGGSFSGDSSYKTDSQNVSPSFNFYLYHAKNITIDKKIGVATILIQALTPINEFEYNVDLLSVNVHIIAQNRDEGNSYDASITYDKRYEMPNLTPVDVTNQSQFTAFYSLFATIDKFEDLYGFRGDNYRALVSNYALPVGTQITMIDYGYDLQNPKYYYYNITQDVYDKSLIDLQNNSEISYKLSDFISMGSTSVNNTYDDVAANKKYFDKQHKVGMEEFIFIVDMKNTNTTGTHLNNSLLLELRNKDDRAVVAVLGARQPLMVYNLYDNGTGVLDEKLNVPNYLYHNIETVIPFESDILYGQNVSKDVIIDTNYESSSMGLNISFYDSNKSLVSSHLLLGTVFKIDNISYFPDSDGVYRIKLSDKVSKLKRNIYIITDNKLIQDTYTMNVTLFASDDGKYNSKPLSSVTKSFKVNVVAEESAIVVNSDDKNKIINGVTGLNQNGYDFNTYNFRVHSNLDNPNVRVSLFKRDTVDASSSTYYEINFNDLFSNFLGSYSDFGYSSKFKYEKVLNVNVSSTTSINFKFSPNLASGTYKLVFRLYDGNQIIEEENQWVIVTKDVEIAK